MSPTPRSTFVTVLAWIFIVLSGFATFIAVLQNVMVSFMPRDFFNAAMQDSSFAHVMPPSTRFMMAHLQLFFLVFLVLCLLTLVTSIGLLQRRNWARLVFIGLMSLSILYNIAGLVLQQSMMSSINSQFPIDSVFKADSAFQATGLQFDQMMHAMRTTILVMTIGFVALFTWIIVKLVSRPVREEFSVAADAV